MKLYQAGEYAAAAEMLRKAHELEPGRPTLFAWAQAERMSGDCEAAAPLYRRLLDDDPPAEQAKAVRQVLALCEEALAAAAPEPTPEPAPVVEPSRERAPHAPRWYTDVVGGALVV